MRLRLRKPVLIHALLMVSFLGAFGFLDYYSALYVSEVAILCVVVLFALLVFSTRMDRTSVLLSLLFLFGTILFSLFYALVFTVRTDAPLLPSVLAQRYYAFLLIAPVTYMLYRSGWKLADFRRIFILAVVLATISRVVVDLVPLASASALSPFVEPPREFLIFRQDTAYGEASFLLRRLDASTLFSALYFGRALLKPDNLTSFAFCLVMTALSTTLLFVNAPRTLVAAVLVALILYSVVLSRPGRTKLFVILLPLLIALISLNWAQLGGVLPQLFGGDLSYTTRVQSTEIAWQSVLQYPLIGFGQESAQSVSYQDLFGEKFFPSDVGLLGVAFQWGLVGLFLYVFFSIWLVANLLKLLWAYTGNTGRIKSREQLFLWALFVLCLTFAITSPVQARFVKTEGLTVAAFSVGLFASHRHGLGSDHRRDPRQRLEVATDAGVVRSI